MFNFRRNKMANTSKDDDYNSNNNDIYCECCHCKKIFMMLVLLILVFMAGIMVGNCGRCHYSDNYYDYESKIYHKHHKKNKLHRGMHQIPTSPNDNMVNQTTPVQEVGGFIVEIEQSN